MKHGDIRWYGFPKPDKRRPVMILTRDSAISYLNEITIAPITTTIRDIPTEVLLTQADGMPRDCAISFDHIQTVQKRKIGGLITALNPRRFVEVSRAISFALQL
ncbi:MAG: type II toxin-antitoxin system PemK/MazF family toxin [Planctomycetes bacterium]|nr:type II toxin-antitoxin system PemK/MazF family toxin [Planctomycetota bacterium]